MGTNYFVRINPCHKCGRYDELHVGKQSVGWKFMFHSIPGKAETYAQWLELLAKGDIFDEYGTQISLNDFIALVRSHQHDQSQSGLHDCYLDNGHDFMKGDFS